MSRKRPCVSGESAANAVRHSAARTLWSNIDDRDAPAHATMFSCGVCTRLFGDRKALAQHEASPPHRKMVAAKKDASSAGAIVS